MNITMGGSSKQNNFFMAKDQLKQDAQGQKQNAHLKMLSTNGGNQNLVRIGPIARRISINNQRQRAQQQQMMMPYADQSFTGQ